MDAEGAIPPSGDSSLDISSQGGPRVQPLGGLPDADELTRMATSLD